MKPVHTDQNMPGRKDSKDKAGGRPRGPAHTMTNATSPSEWMLCVETHGRQTGNRGWSDVCGLMAKLKVGTVYQADH